MEDEIKEILDMLKTDMIHIRLFKEDREKLLDYITNLQTIEQQYSAILSENAELENKITNLQEENERLKGKYNNNKDHNINYNYFKTLYEKTSKELVIEDLVYKCEELYYTREYNNKLIIEKENYKSRNEKAIEYLPKIRKTSSYELDEKIDNLENILDGGDDND